MLRRILATLLIVAALGGTAVAYPGLTVRIRPATCQHDTFRFRFVSTNDHAIGYTVILWHGYSQGNHYRLRGTIPANGIATAWVAPDWNARDTYDVSVFRGKRLRLGNPAWVRTHRLGRAHASLGGCA